MMLGVLLGVLFWDVTMRCWVCCSEMWHCDVGCVVLGCDTVFWVCYFGMWHCFGYVVLGCDTMFWVCCSGMWHCFVGCVVLGCDTVFLGVLFWDVTLCCWVCLSGMYHCVFGCVVLGYDTEFWVCMSGTLDKLQNRNKHYIIIGNIRKEIKRLEDQKWTFF